MLRKTRCNSLRSCTCIIAPGLPRVGRGSPGPALVWTKALLRVNRRGQETCVVTGRGTETCGRIRFGEVGRPAPNKAAWCQGVVGVRRRGSEQAGLAVVIVLTTTAYYALERRSTTGANRRKALSSKEFGICRVRPHGASTTRSDRLWSGFRHGRVVLGVCKEAVVRMVRPQGFLQESCQA